MAKILITESVHPIGPELLTAAGHTVVYADRDMDVIRREIVDADAVLVRIIELPGSLLATAKNLKIVSKHGVGYDNIDLDYCKSHGIAVTITPNANSLSVAEHAFTLMLTLAKNIIPVSNEYREIGFAAKNHAPGIEMTGKTLGLVGMGRIGKHILHMCRDGLDMHVIVYDPYISEIPEGVEKVDDLSELLRRADVVTLHCLLTDETRKLIDRERLALMKSTPSWTKLRSSRRWRTVDLPAPVLTSPTPSRSRRTARSLSCRTSLSRRTTRPQRSNPPRAFPKSQPKTSMLAGKEPVGRIV